MQAWSTSHTDHVPQLSKVSQNSALCIWTASWFKTQGQRAHRLQFTTRLKSCRDICQSNILYNARSGYAYFCNRTRFAATHNLCHSKYTPNHMLPLRVVKCTKILALHGSASLYKTKKISDQTCTIEKHVSLLLWNGVIRPCGVKCPPAPTQSISLDTYKRKIPSVLLAGSFIHHRFFERRVCH